MTEMSETFTAVEVHRVKNGYMVHPSRGWLDRGDAPNWDERIWVFEDAEALFVWLSRMLPNPSSNA